MATPTRLHGSLPEGIRDHHGVFGKQSETPQSRLAETRAKVTQLTQKLEAARETFHAACEDEGQHDLRALKANVSRLARELETATTEQGQWASVVEQSAQLDRSKQFDAKVKEARETRQKFVEHFRDACLQLGRWYSLGSEINELVNSLADRLPTGAVYYKPELKNVLAEMGEDPNPLATLQDEGYSELQTVASWKRHCVVVPLSKGE